jgi:sporulation protein YlmC with PRC-barrel domain
MLRRKLLPVEGICAWINAGIILLSPSVNDLENLISITRGIHCFMEDERVKISELVDKEVYVENLRVGKVKDVHIDGEEWKITHLEIELTKDAAKELLGVKSSFRNVLAISAVGPASKCCTSVGRIDLQVSKGQLHIYLRPP